MIQCIIQLLQIRPNHQRSKCKNLIANKVLSLRTTRCHPNICKLRNPTPKVLTSLSKQIAQHTVQINVTVAFISNQLNNRLRRGSLQFRKVFQDQPLQGKNQRLSQKATREKKEIQLSHHQNKLYRLKSRPKVKKKK